VYTVQCDEVVCARFSFLCFDIGASQVCDVAWSPDGKRLAAVTRSGRVIQVTNNNAHSTVYTMNVATPIAFYGCAFSSSGIFAVSGKTRAGSTVIRLLDPSSNYAIIETLSELHSSVCYN